MNTVSKRFLFLYSIIFGITIFGAEGTQSVNLDMFYKETAESYFKDVLKLEELPSEANGKELSTRLSFDQLRDFLNERIATIEQMKSDDVSQIEKELSLLDPEIIIGVTGFQALWNPDVRALYYYAEEGRQLMFRALGGDLELLRESAIDERYERLRSKIDKSSSQEQYEALLKVVPEFTKAILEVQGALEPLNRPQDGGCMVM